MVIKDTRVVKINIMYEMITKGVYFSSRKEVNPVIRWFLRPIDRFVSWYSHSYFKDGSWVKRKHSDPYKSKLPRGFTTEMIAELEEDAKLFIEH